MIGDTVIGREWMIAAIRQAGGDIVAVMCTDPVRGRAYADEFGIGRSVVSLPELFSVGVDAVYVSTTNERHCAQTIAAAESHVHVLCEKPLATRLADAQDMIAACKKAGVVLATNHHHRNGADPEDDARNDPERAGLVAPSPPGSFMLAICRSICTVGG